MNWKIRKKARYYLVSVIILLVGFGSSALIYLTAVEPPEDIMVAQFEMSKAYRHDLELFGGTANVLAVEFTEWLEGLWHGKQLAFTVAGITIVIAACFFLFGKYLQADTDTDATDENNR